MGKLVAKKSSLEKITAVRARGKHIVAKRSGEKPPSISNEQTKIKRLYSFVNGRGPDYYRKNGWLASALFALYPEINSRFGKVIPQIKLNSDSELSTWETLLITIPTKGKFETAQEKLDDLIQNWVYKQSPEFKKLITLSIV